MYPVRVRVLSYEKEGKNEPDVVTMAPAIDWDFTDKEREEIIDAKMKMCIRDSVEDVCSVKNKPPYVCNGCSQLSKCTLLKRIYDRCV